MINKDKKLFGLSQDGYAAFVITFITMIVVSLIVIAFASDSRITQKNSLANNLATEAYYAAESGINDAYTVLQAEVAAGDTPTSTGTKCAANGSAYIQANSNQIANSGAVAYSCLIVNPEPNILQYQDVVPGRSIVVPITSSTGNDIKNITISWEYYQSGVNGADLTFANCPSATTNPPADANLPALNATGANSFYPSDCGAPLMQVDYVSAANIGTGVNYLNNGPGGSAPGPGLVPYGTIFLEPETNPSAANPSGAAVDTPQTPTKEDPVYYVDCNENTPADNGLYACTETFNPNPSGAGNSTYYLHLQTFYQPANIAISATDTGGSAVDLTDAQIDIDSTGEASGQLKRLVERVCYGEFCNSISPDGAIQSNDCINKQFGTYPGESENPPSDPAGCD